MKLARWRNECVKKFENEGMKWDTRTWDPSFLGHKEVRKGRWDMASTCAEKIDNLSVVVFRWDILRPGALSNPGIREI